MWGRSRGPGKREDRNGATQNGSVEATNGKILAKKHPSVVREASHAGTWYSSDSAELDRELTGWLEESGVQPDSTVRALIAPHAGYRYSGRCAAYAFGHMNPASISRIFVLGPSHHHFTRRCMLTSADVYRTPVGDIEIDTTVVEELRQSGRFEDLPLEVDEAEHSLELLLPYLVTAMKGHSFKLVPIMVGSLQASGESDYGKTLAPYLEDPSNFFAISTDFCHWGSRFSYTPYDRSKGAIYESIESLDREGMSVIESGCCKNFKTYLRKTENTICGRHPVAVLLSMLEQASSHYKIEFVKYEQSSKCTSMRDSSVSYAAAVAFLSDAPGESKKKVKKSVEV